MVSSTQVSQSDSELLPKVSLIPHLLPAPRKNLVPFFIGLTSSCFELPDVKSAPMQRRSTKPGTGGKTGSSKEEGCFRKRWGATPMCTLESLTKWLPPFLSLNIF